MRLQEKFQVAANENIPLVNEGNDPWQRHPISSVPVDYQVRYKTMYMAEYDHLTYENKLKTIFGLPSSKKQELSNISDWTVLDTDNRFHRSYIRVAYSSFINFLTQQLQKSKELDLIYDNPYNRPKLQIVHDVLLQFKRNTRNPYKYALMIEMILYRNHKYHGKHVHVEAIVEYKRKTKDWIFDIVDIHIIGVVSEDGIGMFPVVPYQREQNGALELDENAQVIISTNKDVIDVLRRQNKLQSDNIAADIALM